MIQKEGEQKDDCEVASSSFCCWKIVQLSFAFCFFLSFFLSPSWQERKKERERHIEIRIRCCCCCRCSIIVFPFLIILCFSVSFPRAIRRFLFAPPHPCCCFWNNGAGWNGIINLKSLTAVRTGFWQHEKQT